MMSEQIPGYDTALAEPPDPPRDCAGIAAKRADEAHERQVEEQLDAEARTAMMRSLIQRMEDWPVDARYVAGWLGSCARSGSHVGRSRFAIIDEAMQAAATNEEGARTMSEARDALDAANCAWALMTPGQREQMRQAYPGLAAIASEGYQSAEVAQSQASAQAGALAQAPAGSVR